MAHHLHLVVITNREGVGTSSLVTKALNDVLSGCSSCLKTVYIQGITNFPATGDPMPIVDMEATIISLNSLSTVP